MTQVDPGVVLAAYGNCSHAVAFVELILDTPPSPAEETSIAMMRRVHPPLRIDEVVNLVQGAIQEEIDLGSVGNYAVALDESHLPEFTTYMMGKMGYV